MTALPKLIILGAGGFGREMLAWAEQSVQVGREWEIGGFLDDNLDALADKNTPGRIIGRISDHEPATDEVFICAIGVPTIKRRVSELMMARGGRFTRLFHRTAVLGHNVDAAEGVILCPFTVVSGNNRLGRGVALNLHTTVDHDVVVGDWSQLNCHCDLTAEVQVGTQVFMGSSVVVYPKVQIGDRAHLGGGAVVTRNVDADMKVAGVPARRIE